MYQGFPQVLRIWEVGGRALQNLIGGRLSQEAWGRGLKCCQKNICEGVHLTVKLAAISLQSLQIY